MAQVVKFERPHDAPDLLPHFHHAASLNLKHCEKNRHEGEKCLIVGTGPTIKNKTVMRQIRNLAVTHTVIGLKEAVGYLKSKGVNPTYSVSMDPGGKRQVDRTPPDKSVIYCVASACHPTFFDHLIEAGCEVHVFHSATGQAAPVYDKGMMVDAGCGITSFVEGEFICKTLYDEYEFCPLIGTMKQEIQIYGELFDGYCDVMCGGFTVTNRALALVNYFGFSDIVMAATDFGWRREGGSHYADIVKVDAYDNQYFSDGGQTDGKPWYTKVDQLSSAIDVARKIKAGEVTVLGDTLPGALSKKDDGFLEAIMQMKVGV